VLLAALPYLAAFRAQDSETRFVGLVGGVDDNNVYLDLMRQAAEGEWLFVNNFTPEPCRPAVFNLLYQVLGRLCGLTGLPLIAAHHLFGLASIFLFAFLANGFFGDAFRDGRFRAAGVTLAVFASGLFGLGELLGGAIGWESRSVDSWLAELTTFHSVLIYPHFVFSAALVVGSLHLFLSALEVGRWTRAFGGGLVCSVLIFSHGFDAATVLGTIAVFFLSFVIVTALAPHYDRIKRSPYVQIMVRGILAAFLGMLLFVVYRFGQEALPDWRTWALMAAVLVALWRKVDLLLIVGVGAGLSVLLF